MNHINKNQHNASTRELFPSLHGRSWWWVFCFLFALISCSENEEFDPYDNWEARNTTWFKQVADTARTAINAARAQYGDNWEEHCNWRMYKSLRRSPTFQSGHVEDSICVCIVNKGTGTMLPKATETVRVAFRGWLIPTTDESGHVFEKVFAQTFYGPFDPVTASYSEATTGSFTEGFSTALQYMPEEAEWIVCIPYQQFYGAVAQNDGNIPAYSAARFRIIRMKM